MAHTITLTMPPVELENTDATIEIRIDGSLEGRLLLSKGDVEYWPARHSVNHYQVSWAQLCSLIQEYGTPRRS